MNTGVSKAMLHSVQLPIVINETLLRLTGDLRYFIFRSLILIIIDENINELTNTKYKFTCSLTQHIIKNRAFGITNYYVFIAQYAKMTVTYFNIEKNLSS